jgi:hypothetical protein
LKKNVDMLQVHAIFSILADAPPPPFCNVCNPVHTQSLAHT